MAKLRPLYRQMRKRLGEFEWATRHFLRIPPRSAEETHARLSWSLENQPRFTKGRFNFPFGTLSYVDGHSFRYQYWQIFVQKVYDFQSEREDAVIIDCGGNIGLSAIWFKRRYPKSHVTVFEADPALVQVLTANLKAMRLSDVEVIEAAVWKETRDVSFAGDGADSGRIDTQDGDQVVNAVRLADFIEHNVDLLKLDIEGAEYEVIKDLCDAGKIDYVRRLICEVHGRRPEKKHLGDLFKMLHDNGLAFTVAEGRIAPDLPGSPESTPFPFACDGKFLIHLYAWQR